MLRRRDLRISDLAIALRNAVDGAPDGERVVQIHIFGIRFARDLDGVPLKELVQAAGIPASYHTEIYKGKRLADHVTLKSESSRGTDST